MAARRAAVAGGAGAMHLPADRGRQSRGEQSRVPLALAERGLAGGAVELERLPPTPLMPATRLRKGLRRVQPESAEASAKAESGHPVLGQRTGSPLSRGRAEDGAAAQSFT